MNPARKLFHVSPFFPVAGGKGAQFDTDVKNGVFLPDGSAFVYNTGAGALKRATSGDSWTVDVRFAADIVRPDGSVERPVHRIAPVAVSSGPDDPGTGSLTLIG